MATCLVLTGLFDSGKEDLTAQHPAKLMSSHGVAPCAAGPGGGVGPEARDEEEGEDCHGLLKGDKVNEPW